MFPAEAVVIKLWNSESQDYHQKLNGQLASRIVERFKTEDLRKLGNFESVYLSLLFASSRRFELITREFEPVTLGFELVTRGFELVTRGFELVIRGFELVTRGFKLVTCGFQLVIRGFELVTRGFQLVTRRFELVTRGFELSLLNVNSCFEVFNS